MFKLFFRMMQIADKEEEKEREKEKEKNKEIENLKAVIQSLQKELATTKGSQMPAICIARDSAAIHIGAAKT